MIFNGSTKVKKIYIGSAKVKKVYKGTTKVWNSGYPISYYYGNTLLGVEEVEEGADATHPTIDMPTKSGYTFVGWATSNSENDWVSEYLVTAPANLYAVYVQNTRTVVSGSVSGGMYPDYSCSLQNTNHVTGSVGGTAQIWYNPGTVGNSFTFTLDKKFYATASIAIGQAQHNLGSATFDGSTFSSGTSGTISDGSHTIAVSATNEAEIGHGWAINAAGVTSLVLSDPILWT